MTLRAWVVLACALTILEPRSSAQPPTLKAAMRDKVDNAQRLLEPIVRADFGLVERYAERLSRISDAEIFSWQARPEAEYVRQATSFLEAVQGLKVAATARDADRAASEYAAMISSCVRCHRYVRRARTVSLTTHSSP
jgi:hypothetical protein